MTTGEELDDLAAVYSEPADLWIEERIGAWTAPKIARWCQGRTLDMGWGTGSMALRLVAAGVDLTVLEGSNRLATEARAALPGRVAQVLFEAYDPGPVFDTVLMLHVLEHVERPAEMLKRIWGWLKPGGRLIVEVPNATSIHRRVGSAMTGEPIETLSERDRMVGHLRVYDLPELKRNVREAGFEVLAAWGVFLKPVNNARMLDWPPELIDALCELGYLGPPEDAANIGVIARRA